MTLCILLFTLQEYSKQQAIHIFFLLSVCAGAAVDIQFLLDASGSVGLSSFATVREFIKSFAQNFDIGADYVRIGVTTFASTPQNEFWMNEYTDRTSLLAAIDQIQYTGGTTFTGVALQYVQENAFTPVSYEKSDVAKHAYPFKRFFYFLFYRLLAYLFQHFVLIAPS